MTNQELRIAVGIAEGHDIDTNWQRNENADWYYLKDGGWIKVPNYPEDLTAIHAAVNRKDQRFCAMFTKFISDKCKLKCCWLVKLTSKDWCEVFVEVSKTLKDK